MNNIEKELEAIKQVTREAHEAIKDLKQLIKEGRAVVKEIEDAAGVLVEKRLNDAVAEGMGELGRTFEEAVQDGTAAVYRRFNTLADLLMGEDRETKAKWGKSLTELAEEYAAEHQRSLDSPFEKPRVGATMDPLTQDVTGTD